MNLRDQAERQARGAIAMVADHAAKADNVLRRAVTWFDEHRPQWGPGTLPTWYVDAREYLRQTDGE